MKYLRCMAVDLTARQGVLYYRQKLTTELVELSHCHRLMKLRFKMYFSDFRSAQICGFGALTQVTLTRISLHQAQNEQESLCLIIKHQSWYSGLKIIQSV